MSYLLDTNVLSETVRNHPSPSVIRWLRHVPDEKLYLSVLSVGEIRKGIEQLPVGPRHERLSLWLVHDLINWFGKRMLPINLSVAERWGYLSGKTERSLPTADSLLAATAIHHGLRLVTRNVSDFEFPGLEIINPWAWS